MKFKSTEVNMQPEILKVKTGAEYTAVITLDFTGVESGVIKAGQPISNAGKPVNDGTAVGILYTDATSDNPNGTIIKAFAVVNETNCNTNAGITIATEVKTALPLIVFE